jgi:hypothetical protein
LATAFVGYVVWFRFGWENLPLRCYDSQDIFFHFYDGWQELSGDLRPPVADSLESMMQTLYGEAAVRRVGMGRIEVRPAVLYFDDNGRLADLTTMLTYIYGRGRQTTTQRPARESDCRLAQHHLMEGSQARSCEDPWEPHVFGIIAQDSWPWLTRLFGVRQPTVSRVDDLTTLAPPIRTTGPPRLASRSIPGEVTCGWRFDLRPMYYLVVVFGDLPIHVMRFWRSWTS